jgi:hypothetical protein
MIFRKLFFLILGWGLFAVGGVTMIAPIPIPLVGVVPFLLGCAILTHHSKTVRRAVQAVRHRFAFVSAYLEKRAHRFPGSVRRMMRRTNPLAIRRRARLRARRKDK